MNKIIQEEPDTETWISQGYDEQDLERELRNLANRKAHGSDGIPGEAYKETRTWATKPEQKSRTPLKQGGKYPKPGHAEP